MSRNEQRLKIGGLTFDFLLALVESAPALVTYDELAANVWKGRQVAPETIAQRAKMLRAALSDDARSPRYVELIRGQGYRLLPEVENLPAEPREKSRRRWLAAAAGAVVLAAVALVMSLTTDVEPPGPSVAVLPFDDISQNGDQAYFADGVAEEIINKLSRLDGLEVASRTASLQLRDSDLSLPSIGERLNVATVLEGSVRKSENKLRVTVQLIDIESGYHLWSENFDRELEDIFAVQDEIAIAVAGALGVSLGVGGINEFRGAGTRDFDAYEAYLRGDYAQAVRIDPDYAAAWGHRGLVIASTMHHSPPHEAPAILERAIEHVGKAVELDSGSAHAHADFATVTYATMDWERAEASFAEALALHRDHYSLGHYANMLMRAGRSSESLALHQEREAMLLAPETPFFLRLNVDIALGLFDEARRKAALMDDESRSFAMLYIAINEGSMDDVKAAIRALPQNDIAYREFFAPLLEVIDSPADAVEFFRSAASAPNLVSPYRHKDIALMAAKMGYPELAFEVFLQEIPYTPIRFGTLWHPVMSEVRRLPEFPEFLADVHLVEYWRKHGWPDFCRPLDDGAIVCH